MRSIRVRDRCRAARPRELERGRMVGQIVIACVVGLLIVWVTLAVLLVVLRPPGQSLADLARVFPNT